MATSKSSSSPTTTAWYNPFTDHNGFKTTTPYFTTRDTDTSDYTTSANITYSNVTAEWVATTSDGGKEEGSGGYTKLWMTRILCGPCLAATLGFSCLLLYIILRRMKEQLPLYFAVLLYASSMALLMLTIVAYWLYGLISTGGLKTYTNCQHKEVLQNVVMTLPSYFILMLTGVRVVFIRRPLNHRDYLKLRYQAVSAALILLLVVGISALPLFGLCGIDLHKDPEIGKYCGYGEEGVECGVLRGIIILTCFVLPVGGIFALYGVIHWTIVSSRKKMAGLTNPTTTTTTTASTSLGTTVTTSVNNTVNNTGNTTGNTSLTIANPSAVTASSATANKALTTAANKALTTIRTQIPWCIIWVVFLYIISTLPWLPFRLYPRFIQQLMVSGSSGSVLLIDLLYTLLLLCTALSPLVYIVTSQTLNRELKGMLRNGKKALFCA